MKILATIEQIRTAEVTLQQTFPACHCHYGSRNGRGEIKTGKWFNITLGAKSGQPGSRKSATGRNLPKASWKAHRVFMQAIFDQNPEARIHTAMARYDNAASFEKEMHKSFAHNAGSRANPVPYGSL